MTSMRMRLLFSVSCVRLVLVCSGAVHWWGGGGGWVGAGVMTSMRMRLLFSVSCVPLVLVCSGAVHCIGGGGGDDARANATFVFCADDDASDVADAAIAFMIKGRQFLPQMTINTIVLLPAGLVAKLLLKRYQLLCQPVLAVSSCFT